MDMSLSVHYQPPPHCESDFSRTPSCLSENLTPLPVCLHPNPSIHPSSHPHIHTSTPIHPNPSIHPDDAPSTIYPVPSDPLRVYHRA